MARIGLILAIFGIIYLIKPGIFRFWPFTKTDIKQRQLSPEEYIKYMRRMGVIFLSVGLILLAIGKFNI